jgi:hypothetical protein
MFFVEIAFFFNANQSSEKINNFLENGVQAPRHFSMRMCGWAWKKTRPVADRCNHSHPMGLQVKEGDRENI